MNLNLSDFSNIAIYEFLFLTLIIFVFFRIVNFLYPFIISKNKRNIGKKTLIITEIITWFVFLIGAIQFLMGKNQIFALGIFILLIFTLSWIIWYYLRDIFAGFFFKINNSFPDKKQITFENNKGKIIQKQLKHLEIETNNNEKIFIPYTKLLNGIFSISEEQNENLNYNNTFIIEVKKTEPIKDTIQKIQTAILQLPWISLKNEPKILPISETKEFLKLEITFFSVNNDYIFKIRNHIQNKFN